MGTSGGARRAVPSNGMGTSGGARRAVPSNGWTAQREQRNSASSGGGSSSGGMKQLRWRAQVQQKRKSSEFEHLNSGLASVELPLWQLSQAVFFSTRFKTLFHCIISLRSVSSSVRANTQVASGRSFAKKQGETRHAHTSNNFGPLVFVHAPFPKRRLHI